MADNESSDGVILRGMQPGDAQRCAELEQILFPGDDPWSEAAFLHELTSPQTDYTVILDGSHPQQLLIGYAGIAMLGKPEDCEFEIHTIGIDPAYQRRGYARVLMDRFVAISEFYGGPIFLEVRTDNAPAIALYEAYGFTITGTRKNYYQPSGADAYTMMRQPQRTTDAAPQEQDES
ncbi:ribosomal-protein-alanine N-acetyltransferase [Corynebacterium sp. 13CS0277]|uniref:ribosomal protein S18-alanine N-acetyltransferase n=1 Tax=Corynebacterium sp. 13CS0277 TaxID=2071994 RepID=UPI000D0435AC|nr:ribosomal protein S18-alanine N-acetyltransferase [Corynebacterium sp. 13CS0277]PRQ11570.1 ribosomal-protein-alanine N-acetyltransferase [Corynebacterium sp. 13CS0277]